MKSRHPSLSAVNGPLSVQVRLLRTEGTAVQLQAWKRLWASLLGDKGGPKTDLTAKASPTPTGKFDAERTCEPGDQEFN
jgi:hypothetical protein